MIRPGEPVLDPVAGQVIRAESAMLKIRGRGRGWTCCFFSDDPPACRIHAKRPLECRLLFCRDPGPLTAIIGRDLLPVSQIPGISAEFAELAVSFERYFPFATFNRLTDSLSLKDIAARNAFEELLNGELRFRLQACRRHNLSPDLELALMGRPFFLSARAMGIRVVEAPLGLRLA